LGQVKITENINKPENSQKKQQVLDLSNQTRELEQQRDAETDPVKKKALQDQIDANNTKVQETLDSLSPTLNGITNRNASRQSDYDKDTGHGSKPAEQAKWNETIKEWAKSWRKAGPTADSRSNQSLTFDASSGALQVTNDFIVSVDGLLGDSVIGSELTFQRFQLSGPTAWGDTLFTGEGSEDVQLLNPGNDVLLTGKLPSLTYFHEDNAFVGILENVIFAEPAVFGSAFLSETRSGLLNTEPLNLSISIHPDANFYSLTNAFSIDGTSAFSNGLQLTSSVPEPSTVVLLTVAATVLCGYMTLRRRKRDATCGDRS
jgi:hypothetical protein